MPPVTHDALRQRFRDRFGAAPALLAAAPGRINLIGEHTDYNDGLAMPASIDRDAVCALRQNRQGRYRLLAADLDGDKEVDVAAAELAPVVQQWANYLLGVVEQLRARGYDVPGFDCVLTSAVPAGMGLSSSAAIECALARGLDALYGYALDKWTLARIGQGAENGFVGANTGILDQFASVFGRADTALLLDCRRLTFEPQAIHLPGHRLLVLDTGIRHNLTSSGYADRRADCERAVATLQSLGWAGENLRDLTAETLGRHAAHLDEVAYRRARFVLEENERVARAARQLDAGDVEGFGESIQAGHWGLSELYEVSCPESDAVVAFAGAHAAARGARQMGGGFGGCILAVVEETRVDDFVDELQQDYFDKFGIALEPLAIGIGPGARIVD